MKFLSVVALALTCCLTLSAREIEPDDARHEETIVVTASAIPETVESAPASVEVITKEEIEDRGARDLADVLREVAGLQLARSGSAGRATSLFTRGSNSTHTLVLWNGIEINNPYFSGYDWGQFSTAGIERVEVVRGPYSALYGSDAVAGVVQVMTVPDRGSLDVDLQLGERGLFNGRVGGGTRSGSFTLFGTAEHRSDDGWLANDDLEQNMVAGGLRWESGGVTLGLTGRYNDYDLGIPLNDVGGERLEPSLMRRQTGSELQFALPVEIERGALRWNLDLSRVEHEIDLEDPEDPFGFTFGRTDSVIDRVGLRMTTRSRIGVWVAGGEYERAEVDDVSAYGVNLADETRTSRSVFVQDRITRSVGSSMLEVGIGARWDDFDTFGDEISPRIGFALIRGPHAFRASWGEAFRAPSIGELYFPFSGNLDLEPEKSRSAEIGYSLAFRNGRFGVTLFESDFDNLIFFDNLSFTFQNIGAATTEGLELSVDRRLGRGWSGGVSYMWLDTEQKDTGERLLRRPEHSGSAHLRWAEGPYQAIVTLVHSGDRADVLPVFPYSRVAAEAWTTVDLGFAYDMGVVQPYVKLENALDEEYEEVAGLLSPGRRTIVGIRYRR